MCNDKHLYKLFEPEMILIPSGEFLMGSDIRHDRAAGDNEQPQHKLFLPDFHIALTPITNAQYRAFLFDTDYPQPVNWSKRKHNTGWGPDP